MQRSLPALREDEVRHCQTEKDVEAGFGALKTERGCLPLRAWTCSPHRRTDRA